MTTTPEPSEQRLRERLRAATDGLDPSPGALGHIHARVRTRRRHRRFAIAAAALAVLLVGVLSAAVLAGGDDTSNPYVGSGSTRYLVPPTDAPDLVVAVDPGRPYYGASFTSPDGQTLVLRVQTGSNGPLLPEAQALFDSAPTAELPNGFSVRLFCAGVSSSEGMRGRGVNDPPVVPVYTPTGPLMAAWLADGQLASLQAVPTDNGPCTPPTVAEGPLVDATARLRWVDQAEFDRLLEASPGPDVTAPPTADDSTATTEAPSTALTVPPDDVDAAVTAALPAEATDADQVGSSLLALVSSYGRGCWRANPGELGSLADVEPWDQLCLWQSADSSIRVLTLTSADGFPNLAFSPAGPQQPSICVRRIVGNWWSYYSGQGLAEPCSAGYEFQGI